MSAVLVFALACGVVAVIYGIVTARRIMAADAGSEKMQEIAAAIQEGARAYLNRQYMTIAAVGVVVGLILWALLGVTVGIGFAIGAILSGATGYIGMYISVRANVRTAAAAQKGMAGALAIAFQSGAVTGMLVVGLGLIGVTGYYAILLGMDLDRKSTRLNSSHVVISYAVSCLKKKK